MPARLRPDGLQGHPIRGGAPVTRGRDVRNRPARSGALGEEAAKDSFKAIALTFALSWRLRGHRPRQCDEVGTALTGGHSS
jgi:hypothetical protein